MPRHIRPIRSGLRSAALIAALSVPLTASAQALETDEAAAAPEEAAAAVLSGEAAAEALADEPSEPDGPPLLIVREVGDTTLDDLRWRNRLVVVFADSPEDPRFNEQIELLTSRPSALIERDVIVLTDTDPDAGSPLRIKLRPRGFQMALIGKDGEVELRKPSPWSSRELSRSIDKMPLRKQEIREQKAEAG